MTPLDRPKGSTGIGASLVDMVGGGWARTGPPPNVSSSRVRKGPWVEGEGEHPRALLCARRKSTFRVRQASQPLNSLAFTWLQWSDPSWAIVLFQARVFSSFAKWENIPFLALYSVGTGVFLGLDSCFWKGLTPAEG